MVNAGKRRSDQVKPPEKGNSVKGAKKKQRLSGSIEQKFRGELERQLQDDDALRKRALAKEAKAAERKEDREAVRPLRAFAKEFYREHANSLGPRKKAARVSETELLALGGRKDVILLGLSRRQTRIIFGGAGETRLIFTPEGAGWKIGLDVDVNPELSPEELRSELAKSGRGLWDNDKQKPLIAFQAVNALLTCARDWQDFTALPKSEQEKADVTVQWSMLTYQF